MRRYTPCGASRSASADNHLGHLCTLTADYELTGGRIEDALALEVEIFNRSIGITVAHNTFDARTCGAQA